MCSKSEIESESDDLECPGCYKTRSYAWSDGKCNSCGYDEIEESESDNLECPGCYKTRSYAWSDGKCNSCGYDEIESERAK
jgi:ribosomal protein L37E